MDLLHAVETESLEKIMEILSSEEVQKENTWVDYEALNKTLELGRKDVADFLLNSNCRVNRPDQEEFGTNTPLHHAVILKDVDLVKKILEQNGSVLVKNADGDTPLHLAFLNLSEKIVDTIFNHMFESTKCETIVNPKNRYGYSHMHIACVRDETDLVKLYLDSGEDVNHAIDKNSPSNAGYTPLHFAVRIGCISTIKLLLSRGADPFLEDANYLSAYELNEDRKIEYSMIQYLLNQKNHEKCVPAFHIACAEGNLDCIKKFLEMGFEVNKALSDKMPFCPKHTPLHFAVESGQLKCVKQLLRYGANVNACNAQNMTPLHLALYSEKPNSPRKDHSIVKMLYSALDDPFVEMTDSNGLSYFHVAVALNNVELVRKYLESRHYQVNSRVLRNPRNFSNFTPLHFGVMYGCLEVVELLLKHKADTNCNDEYLHGTPLHMAMERGDSAMANLLLDHGASVGVVRLNDKRTPLHLLLLHIFNRSDECSTEDLEGKAFIFEPLIKRVLSLDCDLNAMDIDGNTALHIVCSKTRISLFYLDTLISCGADINFENKDGDTPFDVIFSDGYVYSTNDCMTLYHHVQDLKALKAQINPRNIACCKKLIEEKYEYDPQAEFERHLQYAQTSRLQEIKRLKATKLHMKTSLYNVISDTQEQLKKRACSNHLKSILDTLQPILNKKDFDVKFPRYGYMVRLWYNSARSYEPTRDYNKSPAKSGAVKRASIKNSRRSAVSSKKNQNKRRRTK